MKNKKRNLLGKIGILSTILFVLTACDSANDKTTNSTSNLGNSNGAEIAMVADGGSIDDQGFNQGTWQGIKKYAEEFDISHKYYQPVEKTTDDYLSAIDLAIEGGAKIIVTPGFRFKEPIFIAQEVHPDVKFVLLDGVPTNQNSEVMITENTVGVEYAEEQSGFLAGYAAVKDGNKKLGFMGGVAVPAVIRYGYGFIQGAQEAAKELNLSDVEISYYYTGTFDATPETQTLAATWYQNGIEVIFACGSGVGQSVMAAAEAASPEGKTIGVDIDWSDESETVLTSAVKSIDSSVYQMLEKFYTDEFPGGENVIMNATNDGVELPMSVSRFTKFTQEDYDNVYAKLADGEFKPKGNIDKSGQTINLDSISDGTVKVTEVK